MDEKKCFGVVYKVTNIVNEKSYIGQTVNSLEKRKRDHTNTALRKDNNFYFHRAIRKYGSENFDWRIIECCNSKYELNLAEEWYIRYYKTFIRFIDCCGYNLTLGGEGSVGYKHSNDTLKCMSEASFKSTKHYSRGKHLLEEHKQKIRLSNIGRKWTDEQRSNYKESMTGKYLGRDNKNAKKFVIITPKGNEFYIIGLAHFSRLYKSGLLCFKLLSAVATNKRNHHRGYKCRYYNEETDSNLPLFEDFSEMNELGAKHVA